MKNARLLALALLAIPRLAWSTPASGLPASLETKAKVALADIAKARTALNSGKPATSQSWLAKAQGLLQTVRTQAPGAGLLGKIDPASGAAKAVDGQSGTALSQAESKAAKLDPSLASKLGVAREKTAQGDTDGGTAAATDARGAVAQKWALSGIESTYQKVSLARSLLSSGDNTKAKSLLDQIPSTLPGLLKPGGL
jgi:hypothetical protein